MPHIEQGDNRSHFNHFNNNYLSITRIQMALQKNDDGSYSIAPRKPGFEAVPFGGITAVDLTGDGNSIGLDGGLEFSAGGALVLATYAATLEVLALVPAYRSGLVSKSEMATAAGSAAWKHTKDKAAYIIAAAIVVSVLPGTMPLFAIASVVGGGFMAVKLCRAFGDALSTEQLETLKKAAADVSVSIPGITDRKSSTDDDFGSAAGYTETDPSPMPA